MGDTNESTTPTQESVNGFSGLMAKPSKFSGSYNDSILDWTEAMAHYISFNKLSSSNAVFVLVSYLEGDALHFVRRYREANPRNGHKAILEEMRKYWLSDFHVESLRSKLASLRQRNSSGTAAYVKDFRSITVQLNISSDEMIDRFKRGLWHERIRTEINLRQPKHIEDAIIIALQMSAAMVPDERPRSTYRQAQVNAVNTSISRQKYTKLTPEMAEDLERKGICLYCRNPGHKRDTCPKLSHRKN